MIDTSMKIDKKLMHTYMMNELRLNVDWYFYGNGYHILTVKYGNNENDYDIDIDYEVTFKTDDITYHFYITPYDENITSSHYVVFVQTTDCNNVCVSGTKHVFTYDEIENFINDCFE